MSENTICGNIWFTVFIPWPDQLLPPSDQFQFNLCRNILSGSHEVGTAMRAKFPVTESHVMWAGGTLLLIQRCRYFDISTFFLFLVQLEGHIQLFHTQGSFFWHRKRKARPKKTHFCHRSWSDCTKLLTAVQMWPPQVVERPPSTARCRF